MVRDAQKSIDISTFKAELTIKPRGRKLKAFFDALMEKQKAGISVRFLVTKRENYGHIPFTNLYAVRALKEAGIRVRHPRFDQLCHAKLLIVDRETALLGSHNLSIKSCSSNFETSIFFTNKLCVEEFFYAYEKVWANGKNA